MKTIKSFFVSLIIMAILSGCASDEKEQATEVPITPSPSPAMTATTAPVPTETPTPTITPTLVNYPENPVDWNLHFINEIPDGAIPVVLENWQKNMIIAPVISFFNDFYVSDTLQPEEGLVGYFSEDSRAWNGSPEKNTTGLKGIYQNLKDKGLYVKFEYPVSDTTHYGNWTIYGMAQKDNQVLAYVSFILEPQSYSFYNISNHAMADNTAVMTLGRRLYIFTVIYQNDGWKISDMYFENLQ